MSILTSNPPTDVSGSLTVVGDLHGQAVALRSLLSQLRDRCDFDERWLVFVGDFVDRGPNSRGVLDTVIALSKMHKRTAAVTGNHDFALAAALGLVATPKSCNWGDRYLRFYEAGPTFISYGVQQGDLPALRAAMPSDHLAFLKGLPWAVFHPQYLIVHAGLLADQPYAAQATALRSPDVAHNRPPWLCEKLADGAVPKDCPVTIVSGHVPVPVVTFRDRRVLVDTTGGRAGVLSAVLLPERLIVTSEPLLHDSGADQ